MRERNDQNADYFADLCQRRADARPVPFREVVFRGGAWAAANGCHANVDRWVAENSGTIAIRGWLLQSHGGAIRIIAHSVVMSSDGSLFDLTPLADERERPSLAFMAHDGSAEAFFRLAYHHADQFFWP